MLVELSLALCLCSLRCFVSWPPLTFSCQGFLHLGDSWDDWAFYPPPFLSLGMDLWVPASSDILCSTRSSFCQGFWTFAPPPPPPASHLFPILFSYRCSLVLLLFLLIQSLMVHLPACLTALLFSNFPISKREDCSRDARPESRLAGQL